jgi:hypothetical protein
MSHLKPAGTLLIGLWCLALQGGILIKDSQRSESSREVLVMESSKGKNLMNLSTHLKLGTFPVGGNEENSILLAVLSIFLYGGREEIESRIIRLLGGYS